MHTYARTDRVVVLGSAAAVIVLVTCAMVSPVLAVAAVGLVAVLVLVLTFGVETSACIVMAAAMFLAPLNKLKVVPGQGGGGTVSDFVFLVAFALLVPLLIRGRIRLPATFVAGSAVLLVTGLTASAASALPGYSLNLMLRLTVVALGLPLIFMWWRPSLRTMGNLGFAYVLGASTSVAYGLLDGPVAAGRYVGLTTHTNYLGLSSTLALSLIPFLLTRMSKPMRPVLLLCGLGGLAGVWISGSRAALLVVITLALAYPVLERSLRATLVVVAAMATTLALSDRLLAATGSNALGRLVGGGGNADAADEARRAALSSAWQALQTHPIRGNGFVGVLEAHNIYLQVAVATGVIGAVGFVLLLWPALAPLFGGRGAVHLLGYPGLAYVLLGLVQPNLWDRMIWGVLALSYVAANIAPQPRDASVPRPAPLPRASRRRVHPGSA